MKKILALVLALAICFTLCACSKEAADNKSDDSETINIVDNCSDVADVADLKANYADELAKIKVGFIFLHDENSTYDLNFLNAGKAACEELGVEYILKTNIPEGQECYNAAADLVDAGCTIVFADSFGHEDYMIQAAKEFPEVQFCHATGTKAHTTNLDNFHNAFAEIYEGRYLAGIAAGMKLNEMIENGEFTADEAKIGYVGAFTYAEVVSGYTSFFLGARSVCPTATMEVTFTGSWYDETAEKEGAQNLINNGCKLISQHADSMGAPTACEKAGVPNVSYNGSTVDACPNTFIVASRIDWVAFLQYMISCSAKDVVLSRDWTGTLANGAVTLTEINEKAAAPGTADAIAKAKQELIDGTRHVYDLSTFTIDGKTVETYAPGDATDATFEAEKNPTVKDGYVDESGYRSAPFFDATIDGITLLDTKF